MKISERFFTTDELEVAQFATHEAGKTAARLIEQCYNVKAFARRTPANLQGDNYLVDIEELDGEKRKGYLHVDMVVNA